MNQPEAKEIWNHLFLPKIDRLALKLQRLKTNEEKVLLLKICFLARLLEGRSLEEEIIHSKNPFYREWSEKLWPFVEEGSFREQRNSWSRMAKWILRIGLAQKIWRSI